MSIHSRLCAAAFVAGAASLLFLARGDAQQMTKAAPARRATAAPATTYAPYLVQEQQLAFTVELQQLHAEEIQAAESAQSNASALAKLPANASESDREGLKAALRDALVRQFDAQQKRRSEEIASIEERLGKLKETLQKRGAAKDAIVGKRLDQLTGVKDDLAWEETRPPVPQPGYGMPGLKYPTAPGYAPSALTPAYPSTTPGVEPLAVPAIPVPGAAPALGVPPSPTFRLIPGKIGAPPPAAPATPALPAPVLAPTVTPAWPVAPLAPAATPAPPVPVPAPAVELPAPSAAPAAAPAPPAPATPPAAPTAPRQ